MFNKKRKLGTYRYKNIGTQSSNKIKLGRKPHPTLTKLKKIFILFATCTSIVLVIYGIFFSGYFNITETEIINQSFDQETLGTEMRESIKSTIGRNIFFIDTTELEKKIISVFPGLEKVEIKKNYPKKLTIEFFEYPLAANIVNQSNSIKKTYIINSIGYVIKEDFENPNLPYISIKSDEPINTNNPVIEKTKLRYIMDTINYFQDKFGMKVSAIEYKPIARELHILTERQFYIWLDIQKPAEEQFKKLKKALVKLDIYKENLEYIDLRIAGGSGNKIIYKRK